MVFIHNDPLPSTALHATLRKAVNFSDLMKKKWPDLDTLQIPLGMRKIPQPGQ